MLNAAPCSAEAIRLGDHTMPLNHSPDNVLAKRRSTFTSVGKPVASSNGFDISRLIMHPE